MRPLAGVFRGGFIGSTTADFSDQELILKGLRVRHRSEADCCDSILGRLLRFSIMCKRRSMVRWKASQHPVFEVVEHWWNSACILKWFWPRSDDEPRGMPMRFLSSARLKTRCTAGWTACARNGRGCEAQSPEQVHALKERRWTRTSAELDSGKARDQATDTTLFCRSCPFTSGSRSAAGCKDFYVPRRIFLTKRERFSKYKIYR